MADNRTGRSADCGTNDGSCRSVAGGFPDKAADNRPGSRADAAAFYRVARAASIKRIDTQSIMAMTVLIVSFIVCLL